MRVSFRSVSLNIVGDYDCGIAAAEGETMEGRETAKKQKDAVGFAGRQDRVRSDPVADQAVVYRFASVDFPISCRESDWILKLGPPLG